MAGLAAVAIAGRPTAAITAIATSANARRDALRRAGADGRISVEFLMELKIVRTAPNRYVSEAERASVGNEKLTIAGWGLVGPAGAWRSLVGLAQGADRNQQGMRWGLPLKKVYG